MNFREKRQSPLANTHYQTPYVHQRHNDTYPSGANGLSRVTLLESLQKQWIRIEQNVAY